MCNLRDEMLSVSLIKRYAINQNNENARDKYGKFMSESHVNHSLNFSDLILSQNFRYLGISPDGIVNCWRYGVEYVEIMRPLKCRDNFIEDMIFGSCGYLKFGNGGAVKMIKTRAYYY